MFPPNFELTFSVEAVAFFATLNEFVATFLATLKEFVAAFLATLNEFVATFFTLLVLALNKLDVFFPTLGILNTPLFGAGERPEFIYI
jgi:hypothetical protein